MNTPLWTDEYISIAIEDSGIADEDWLPVELMLKTMRDEYESRRATQDAIQKVMTPGMFERVIGALRVAMQMAEIVSDWNMDDVEIDGQTWRTWDIREQMRIALADLGRPQEDDE